MNPTDQQIDALFDRLEKLDLKKLRLRLKDALKRDRSGSAAPDGFPSQTMGGSRGGAELTPTEAAAHALIFGKDRDLHHKYTSQACDMLDQGVMSLNAVVNLLDKIKSLIEDAPIEEVTECESCARCPDVPSRAPDIYGDVGGRLHRKMHLCRPCYRFCSGQPAPAELPSMEQLVWYANGKGWRVRGFVGGLGK